MLGFTVQLMPATPVTLADKLLMTTGLLRGTVNATLACSVVVLAVLHTEGLPIGVMSMLHPAWAPATGQ